MWRLAPALIIGALMLAALVSIQSCGDNPTSPPKPAPKDLASLLESAIEEYGIPGMAAAVVRGDSIECAVAGLRRLGAADSIQEDDLFHIGSNAKAMTATVIGVLIEQVNIMWNETIPDLFPELADSVNALYRTVTLENLLSHRAGIPAFLYLEDFEAAPEFTGTIRQQRYAFTKWLLKRPPEVAPGDYHYSNAGYVVVAAIAERRSGMPWEDLVHYVVFAPLGIEERIGWPGLGDPDQPWGHLWISGNLVPHDPNGPERMPPIAAPAGDVSMSIGDYAVFLRMNLRGLLGVDGPVTAATIQRMHTPIGDYGFGWAIVDFGGNTVSTHDGSAGTFYCTALIDPARDIAIAVIANSAHTPTLAGIGKVLTRIYDAE